MAKPSSILLRHLVYGSSMSDVIGAYPQKQAPATWLGFNNQLGTLSYTGSFINPFNS
jgi:hypothetical protein